MNDILAPELEGGHVAGHLVGLQGRCSIQDPGQCVLGALVVACRVCHMRPIDAWGSVSGGMTSSAALMALRRTTDSNDAAISYAAAYAVASVLLTISGRVLMLLLV